MKNNIVGYLKPLISRGNTESFCWQLILIQGLISLTFALWIFVINTGLTTEFLIFVLIPFFPFLCTTLMIKKVGKHGWLWLPFFGCISIAFTNLSEVPRIISNDFDVSYTVFSSFYFGILGVIPVVIIANLRDELMKFRFGVPNNILLYTAMICTMLLLSFVNLNWLLFLILIMPILSHKNSSLFGIPAYILLLISCISLEKSEIVPAASSLLISILITIPPLIYFKVSKRLD